MAAYIAECAGRLKVGSILRRLNVIAEAHKATELDSPTSSGMVRNTLKGIRRTVGTAAVQKAPAVTADIRAMLEATDTGLIGTRDRAMVLLGFAGAFRRSEIVGLDFSDLTFSRDGLTVTLRRSKTDQEYKAARLAFRMALILRRVQFAPCKLGLRKLASQSGLRSVRSIATVRCSRAASRPLTLSGW